MGYPRGVMVKALDCGIVVREFKSQSRYYVHFRTNIPGKGINLLRTIWLCVDKNYTELFELELFD